MSIRLFTVIPCFDEEAVLRETAARLRAKYASLVSDGVISDDSRILFVNDGSDDATWQIIRDLHGGDPVFQGISLAGNCGHQNALLAGLNTAASLCDAAITMDADLQDDPDAIDAMLEKYAGGADIVYGVRSERKKDSIFKRNTAQVFYRLMHAMGAKIVYNHADFRLMSFRALQALLQFGEVNLFLRGMIPMIGFPSAEVTYERGERAAGKSKYPVKAMVRFAVQGITSFSVEPIRMITRLGFFIFFVSILVLIYSLVRHYTGHTITGWTTTVLSVWSIGGLMMISLGVLGEYIGRIYMESKGRPRYIITEYLKDEKDTPDLIDRKGIV